MHPDVVERSAGTEEVAPQGDLLARRKLRAFPVPRGVHLRRTLLIGSFFLMILFFWSEQPGLYLTLGNIHNLVNGMPVLAALAVAVTVVLILGEFDLSAPNVAELTSVVVCIAATQTGMGFAASLVLGLVAGLAAGATNGTAVAYGRASAFVVTLAVGSIAAGVELLVQGRISLGQTSIAVSSLPSSLQWLSSSYLFGFESAVYVFLGMAIAVGLALHYTPWGRYVQAIGGNETAARLAGVPVRRTKMIAFTLTGVLAAFAGMLFSARNGYFASSLPPFLLPAYAAAFFGAASVARRSFSIPATLFGTLYLSVLANGLTVMNQPLWVISVVQGLVLFIAVLIARSGT